MLEGLATWVLNTYLGQYLENLNTDQLSIGLLKGEVELENVPLRKDALRYLDMSMEIRAGFVGKVRLQIPVARLRSEPWIIAFEQLYLVAGPINLNEYDEEAEKSANLGRKISNLDSVEATWRSKHDSVTNDTTYGSSYSSWLSYGTSFITNIIENIQLKIQDVHIRYEDDRSKPGELFACGFTIESLTMQSSDQHWVPKFIYAGDKSISYKLLELKNFGIYWDTSTELFSNKSIGELAALMVSSINGRDHDYILDPVSASACLKRNMSANPLRSRSAPRFTCDLKLEKFPLLLNDLQYNQIISSLRFYDRLESARPYRKWRPRSREIKGNAREWWHYAIQCHLDKIKTMYRGRNWAYAFERAKAIRKYVNIYCDHLRNPVNVSVEMQRHKSEVEQELSFEELSSLRELCMEKVANEFANQRTSAKEAESSPPTQPETSPTTPTKTAATTAGGGEGILQSWFPAWAGWYSTPETEQQTEGLNPISRSAEEKPLEGRGAASQLEEEILYVISDSIENSTFMKRDAVFAQLSFSLKKGNVTLSKMREHSAKSIYREPSPLPKESSLPLFELEFSNVEVAFESRPRNQSFTFDVELGTVSLRDQVTEGSSFPLLISQQRDTLNLKGGRMGLGPTLTSSAMYARLSRMISSVSRLSGGPQNVPQAVTPGPLFSLSYEKKPSRSSRTDHRLVIASQALDIVYNQHAFGAITDFFFPPSLRQDEDQLTRTWTYNARERYEKLKKQTKEELRKNWETVIQGLMTMERKRWDIQLDISAPQIIVPEHLEDENATLVVLDFGKLVFCSSQQEKEGKAGDVGRLSNSDDEDAFETPCSTPEEFHLQEEPRKTSAVEDEPTLTETTFHQHLYDKFDLKLCDMQVLVAKVKDNWRFACQKGTGPMHVIDRFNINLHLEHRVLEILPDSSASGDSHWPHLTLSGSLPHLVVHINEQKVQAIRNISSKYLLGTQVQSATPSQQGTCTRNWSEEGKLKGDATVHHGAAILSSQVSTQIPEDKEYMEEGYEASAPDARLIVMQFNIEKLSIELQSRRRSVAELQVTGVRAQASRRPSDISASLSVHSLLLVDALQTFGSDFELLVASHKHISMDSVSGSLLDSDPCSPTSPASPDASLPGKPTSPIALSLALNSLACTRAQSPAGERGYLRSPPEIVSPTFGHLTSSLDGGKDSETLINIEVTYIGNSAMVMSSGDARQNGGSYLFCSVQFNALDVIANQETVVELVGFIHQLFFSQSKPHYRGDSPPYHPPSSEPPTDTGTATESSKPSFYGSIAGIYSPPTAPAAQNISSSMRAEVNFDFHKLTILLLRAVLKEKEMVGRKVGTAVLSHAKIEASIVNDMLTWEGSLGGFQIRDVTPEGNKHQCIVSVGHDPIVESSQDLVSQLHSGIYQSHIDPRREFGQRAFSFKVVRPLVLLSTYEEAHRKPSSQGEVSEEVEETLVVGKNNKIYVQLHLASVCYTHSPQFLEELKSCAQEFKQYMTQVASSIKQAATEVAIGLVSKRIESFSTLSGGSARDASPRHLSHFRHQNNTKSTDTLIFPKPPPASTLDSASLSPTHGVAPDLSFNAELDIILETPIVVLPESPNSSNVLVAHLGQISIRNKEPVLSQQEDGVMDFFPIRTAAFEISVNDMSLFALNVDERLRSRDIIFHPLSATMMNAEELYSCREHGTPILHSTSLELTLTQRRDAGLLTEYEADLVFPSDIYLDVHSMPSDSFALEGGFITPLKVSVSRHQYQLICQAVSNLSPASVKKSELNIETKKLSTSTKKEADSEDPSLPPRVPETMPERHVPIKGLFTIPSLCVELRGDACQTEEPLVNLVLKEISAVYETCEPFKSNTQITLRSLVMEDLQLSDSQSGHHILMKSENVEPKPLPPSSSIPPVGGSSAPMDIPIGTWTYVCNDVPYISSSCPEMWAASHPGVYSTSLPVKLEMEKPFYKTLKKPAFTQKRSGISGIFTNQDSLAAHCTEHKDDCPCTPPPSPEHGSGDPKVGQLSKDEALVNISIYTVDPRSPDFLSKYDGNVHFVDITLNDLVTVVNLESWVMLLDFFRSPSQREEIIQSNELQTGDIPCGESKPTEEANMILEVHVRSLTLVLNREAGEMAKAAVNQVWIRSVGSAGDLTLNGRLGSLSLIDCTPYGQHYREKFLTVGTEAMVFQLFRYSANDVSLLRNCDIRLKLKMSSIMYVHSHRFLQELTQFFQQFLFLRDELSDWRAVRAGLKVNERVHGTRVSLDISAGSPIIFIPMWSHSDKVLAVDLGSLSVSNKFLWSGTPDTISKVRRPDLFDRLASSPADGYFRPRSGSGSLRSRSRSGSRRLFEGGSRTPSGEEGAAKRGQKCLLDVMQVSLVNMDLFRSERGEVFSKKGTKRNEQNVWDFGSFTVVRKGSSLLKDKCALKLQVERNLDGEISRIVPDFSIHGVLTKVHATIDLTTYELIRGLLAHNLGEPVPEMKLQPSFLSLQQAAKPHRKILFPASHIWTTLSIHLDLDDVIVEAELTDDDDDDNGKSDYPVFDSTQKRTPFARVNFIKSKLLYESFSDSSQDVDLVSQEILISDTRFQNFPANKRSNVFSHILIPAQDKNLKNENPLQAEVHYRSTRDVTRFTVLLNNMRLMAIMDWWKTAQTFIQSAPPAPPGRGTLDNNVSVPGAVFSEPPLFEEPYSKGKVNPPRLNPMVESTGLMTKHSLIADEYQIPFELKINITDSELVIVENSSEWDTSAVILKTTAVVSYRPHFQERPVSCNLNQCELYSCTLGLEEDTALSIIDPVTVNIEVNDRTAKSAATDITNIALQNQHTIEISLHQLNIRLSYHDMKMFQRILESIPRQKEEATSRKSSRTLKGSRGNLTTGEPANFTAQVEKLSVLGFSNEDCLRGLKACVGRLDEAALWLTQNAQPQPDHVPKDQPPPQQDNTMNLRGIELKTGSINVTIIDDCGDCDVPLLEVCLLHLGLKQDCDWKGSASCTLSIDYYNRGLSGWEPFVEPWKCGVEWQLAQHNDLFNHKFHLSLAAEGVVNVTITNTLLDLYRLVRDNWTDDYYNRERQETESEGKQVLKESRGSPSRGQRRRTPFVPFALQNDTGCDLLFYPLINAGRFSESSEAILGEVCEDNWRKVASGKTVSFAFEEKAVKQRHCNSHTMKSHRLIVKVGNWNPVGPVTVDKVGVYFRLGLYQAALQSAQMPSVRIVFDISMDGLARKLIRVRSALMFTNGLPHAVELKLENISFRLGDVKTLQVPSRARVPIPLLYVWSRIFIKPLPLTLSKGRESPPKGSKGSWIFCRVPIHWRTLLSPEQQEYEGRVCHSVQTKEVPYRFYVHVRRDNYPPETVSVRSLSRLDLSHESAGVHRTQDWIQPGHTITLLSPLTISNLLPFDLHYSVKNTGDEGRMKTGQDAFLSSVDPEEEVDMSFWTDCFVACGNVSVRPGSSPYVTSVKLTDSSGRPVHLQVKVQQKYGKALKVTVSAFFWLINKTGLPIVFKQEGTNVESAGQDAEHEVARCAAPLLFSFSDLEASPMLVARVGKNLHMNAVPHFCKKFPLTQGTRVRRLHVGYKDHRPDLVYELGVDVRTGRGRFRDTYMVTLSPRFHLENRSSHELIISQKCFTSCSSVDPELQKTWLRAIPGCWLPFHWPRLDKDPLLCVCLCDVSGCFWSGGFLIDKTNSFNVNIRDSMGQSHFLRVEVLMSEATFFVVFTEPHSLPPPFRVDNFSLVPITYFQTGTHDEYLRSVVRPRYCVPYAWDEVTLPPHLTCMAPGGTSATYNLNVLGEGARLTYENFIYIVFLGTFKGGESGCLNDHSENDPLASSDLDSLQLVLDVTEGSRVRLGRKEMGRRSQLWRMTSTGMLQHEGSSPPYDPTSRKPRSNANILVLDIAGPAPLPNEYTPLMLRKPDDRRRLTQTWRFTEDGRLCCQHPNMFVQAKDGFLGLSSGNDVVLGPPRKVYYSTMANGVPVEQAVGRQRLRPGSGVLAIKVVMDGPTRVLQIIDVQNKSSPQVARTEAGDLVYIKDSGLAGSSSLSAYSKEKSRGQHRPAKNEPAIEEMQVQVVLEGGIGVSVVSSPEELFYALFSDIVLEYMSSSGQRTFDCSVRDIQADNQLPKAQCPVVLFVSPQCKSDQSRHLPALQITSHQLKSPSLNAYIFKHLMVTLKNLTLTIEEALLCKCLVLLGHDRTQASLEKVEESEYETQRMLAAATSANATRYYFTHLKLVLNQVRLSVLASKNLTPELRNIRRKVGLTLVQFENALVNLDPFVRCHPFETSRFLIDSIRMHYESELRSQAMRILGSTDFLGNPFGLLADVSEGVQELVRDGSVGGLVMNVTHGMANSTAKVTGTLSNAVGRVTMDTKHEETRQRLLTKHLGQSPDHFIAGLMGFGLGLYGGLTSIVAQTYTGATKEGLPGFFSGFAKGMVGTVTKPAIGLLDLAAGTASAVRETSKNPAHKLPAKTRKPRLVVGINGMMPRFQERDAAGQELMRLFDESCTQIYLGYEVLKEGEDDLRILISSEQILVFSWMDPAESPTVVLRIGFRDLYSCHPIALKLSSEEPRYYIELTMTEMSSGLSVSTSSFPPQLPTKRPKVRCDSYAIAVKVSDEVNFAKTLYEELRHTVTSTSENDDEETQETY